MVIAKKPINNTSKSAISNTEKAAEAFISGAGNVPKEDSKKKKRKRPFLMRFDEEMLDRIGKAVGRSGNSWAAWIRNALNRALDEEGV